MAPTRLHTPLEDESASPTQRTTSTTTSNTSPSTAPPAATSTNPAENIAQAYKELTRGEQAATALEANLAKLESRLDELLAGLGALEEPRGDDNHSSTAQADQEATKPSRASGKD